MKTISMKEFEKIIKGNEEKNISDNERILDLLMQNRNCAVELSDIIATLKPNLFKKSESSILDFGTSFFWVYHYTKSLEELEREGKIRKACQGEETYYTII